MRDCEWYWSHPVWQSNHAEVTLKKRTHPSPVWEYKFFGIRFDPAAVADLLPKKPRLSLRTSNLWPPPPDLKHAGGAPRKEFWDDLWLAVFERLWLTDWKPKNQAEIEDAMLDWAASNGHKLGPTSVKKPAKKLFLLSQK